LPFVGRAQELALLEQVLTDGPPVLLETFADFLGKHWTQAHHDAWVKGYEAVSSLMLQGTQEPPVV
jgi:hypothetical protein